MSAKAIIQRDRVEIDGTSTPFTLFRVLRRKHVHVIVDDDGELVVRAPWRCSVQEARQVILEHGDWVTDTLVKARAIRRERPALAPGSRLTLLDEELVLVVRPRAQLALLPAPPAPEGAAARRDDVLSGPAGTVYRSQRRLCVEPNSIRGDVVRELLEEWFRQQAVRRLPRRLSKFAARLGVRPARVSIRAQKTRWGSCSSNGVICLNWRLVLLPPDLADYILVHELCHLRHMNHSSRFWNLVATLVPDYRKKRERIAAIQPALAL
ncbi:MAG: SprT family zinc-dependent metalloprotease [Gammaproteobacteria bacterium]|nr:SprT family zinc-dependent metalloprotease [Gammaproteobacteria bacterium]